MEDTPYFHKENVQRVLHRKASWLERKRGGQAIFKLKILKKEKEEKQSAVINERKW